MLQHLSQVMRKAEVIVVSDRLSDDDRVGAFLRFERTMEPALQAALQRHGREAHIAVVPQGPYVLTTVGGRRLALGTAWEDAG
jgi:nickel-dependent lactate racemase